MKNQLTTNHFTHQSQKFSKNMRHLKISRFFIHVDFFQLSIIFFGQTHAIKKWNKKIFYIRIQQGQLLTSIFNARAFKLIILTSKIFWDIKMHESWSLTRFWVINVRRRLWIYCDIHHTKIRILNHNPQLIQCDSEI